MRWLSGLLLCALAQPVAAQEPADMAALDSAAVARAAWSRATAAYRAGDLSTSRREVARAEGAWPTQPDYLWAKARLAAAARDSVTLERALRAYADLGLGRDLRADTTIARFLTLPSFGPIVAAHDANRAPLIRSQVRASLPDPTFWAEGMDYDARTGNFYVSSVRHRTIAEIRPSGEVRELWPRGRPELGAIFGVRVDAVRRVLWVTTSGLRQTQGYRPADSAIAALLRVRISDGAIERRWDIPAEPGGHVLGDLAIGPRGDVYFTDSKAPVLYLLRAGTDSVERITNPLFRSLQGLAPIPDGRSLYLADYSHGLLRVELATGRVSRLHDAPGSTSLGCDGIVWHRGSLIAVQNGVAPARVMRFALDTTGNRILRADVLDRHVPLAVEPTVGAVAGNVFVYVANSQWNNYEEDGTRKVSVALAPPVLLAVPLTW
jgi:sugar lactone lactonase YvrE